MNSICYICLDQQETLIKPCSITNCSAMIHPKCLRSQIKFGNMKCGICRTDIVLNDSYTKNGIKLSKVAPIDLYIMSLFIVQPILTVLPWWCEYIDLDIMAKVFMKIYFRGTILFFTWEFFYRMLKSLKLCDKKYTLLGSFFGSFFSSFFYFYFVK